MFIRSIKISWSYIFFDEGTRSQDEVSILIYPDSLCLSISSTVWDWDRTFVRLLLITGVSVSLTSGWSPAKHLTAGQWTSRVGHKHVSLRGTTFFLEIVRTNHWSSISLFQFWSLEFDTNWTVESIRLVISAARTTDYITICSCKTFR